MIGQERPEEVLTANLRTLERVIAFAARRYRLEREDAEEFAAVVKLRLVENDYAIIRAYEERCSFATYMSIVVQRMALDYRIHTWGKWHASAEATRLGPAALELEQLLHRDGRTLDEALVLMEGKHGATRETLLAIAQRLPPRAPRHRLVALEEAEEAPAIARPSDAEDQLFAKDRRRSSEQLSALMSAAIARLPDDDRLILQLRFEGGMTVAQIARSLHLDQKLTYRRMERNMREIRRTLERAGVASRDVLDLIGRDEALVHFTLGNQESRPSMKSDESATAGPPEESQ